MAFFVRNGGTSLPLPAQIEIPDVFKMDVNTTSSSEESISSSDNSEESASIETHAVDNDVTSISYPGAE